MPAPTYDTPFPFIPLGSLQAIQRRHRNCLLCLSKPFPANGARAEDVIVNARHGAAKERAGRGERGRKVAAQLARGFLSLALSLFLSHSLFCVRPLLACSPGYAPEPL